MKCQVLTVLVLVLASYNVVDGFVTALLGTGAKLLASPIGQTLLSSALSLFSDEKQGLMELRHLAREDEDMYHITRDQMSVIIADDTGIRDSASITSLLDGIATMSDSDFNDFLLFQQ